MRESTENLVEELKKLNSRNEWHQERKTYISLELDERIATIQDQLNEFDNISTADWNTIDGILTKLRNKIGAY